MEKNKYYNVPVTARMVTSNDVPLLRMLKIVDEELYDREVERVRITYEEETGKRAIKAFNRETSQIFNERNLPERLLLIQDNFGLREIETGVLFECKADGYLDSFELDGMAVIDLFVEDECYTDKANKFICDYFLNRRKVLSKTEKK